MRFDKWVEEQGGAKGLGAKLKISAPRVGQWLRKEATPQALLMQRMVKLSKGKLSYDDVINFTTAGRR